MFGYLKNLLYQKTPDTILPPQVQIDSKEFKVTSIAKGVFSHLNQYKPYYIAGLVVGLAVIGAAYAISVNSTPIYTDNEEYLLKTLGPSALNFEESSTQTKVLFLSSKKYVDAAISTRNPDNYSILRKINNSYDLKYASIETAEDACRVIASSKAPIDSLIIQAHGTPNSISLNHNNVDLDKNELNNIWNLDCFKNLKKDAVISLYSCSTGEGEDSFAQQLATSSSRIVVAAIEPIRSYLAFLFSSSESDHLPGIDIKLAIGSDGFYESSSISKIFTPLSPPINIDSLRIETILRYKTSKFRH